MRQDDAFRAALLLAYLHGEPRSAAALGDFLEEQGEPRVKPYGDRPSRSRVVLGNLPARMAHELACEYAEEALTWFEASFPSRTAPRAAVEGKRLWLAEKLDDDELVDRRKQAFRLAESFRDGSIGASPDVRSRRQATRPYHQIWNPRALHGERICQSAGHAASFAVHTTALYAARFAVIATQRDEIERRQLDQIERLESALASHAYASAY